MINVVQIYKCKSKGAVLLCTYCFPSGIFSLNQTCDVNHIERTVELFNPVSNFTKHPRQQQDTLVQSLRVPEKN